MDLSSAIFLAVICAAFLCPLCGVLLAVIAGRAIIRGRRLEKQGQIEDAIRAYLAGTRLMVFFNVPQQAINYAHVAKLYFQRQHWDQAYQWAERSLTSEPKTRVAVSARHTAAFSAYERDEREQAITHFERLAPLAEADHQQAVAHQARSYLAVVQAELGRLDEAIAGFETLQSEPQQKWHSLLNQVECRYLQGRFDEAWQLALALADDKTENPRAAQSRRYYRMSWQVALCAAVHKIDQAWDLFLDIRAQNNDDKNSRLWCAVAEVFLLALRNETQSAKQKIDSALQSLAAYQTDRISAADAAVWPPPPGVLHNREKREILRSNYAILAHALFYLGDFPQSQRLWRQSLTFNTAPVRLPEAYYSLGECERAQGNLISAIEWYHAAVKQNIATHHAALARERLEQMQAVRMDV